MMRWVFYFLLVVNASYFSWSLMRSEQTENANALAKNDNKPKRGLTLAEESGLEFERSTGLAVATISSSTTATPSNQSNTPITVDTEPVFESGQHAFAAEKHGSTEGSNSLSKHPVLVPVESNIRPEHPPEHSLVEHGFTKGPSQPEELRGAQVDPTSNELSDALCLDLGPLVAEEEKDIVRILESRQIPYTTITQTEEAITGYVVYMANAFKREQALSLSNTLRQQGIDSYVLTKEPFNNAIALGHYKVKNNADKMKVSLEARGLTHIKISQRVREITQKQAKIVLYEPSKLDDLRSVIKKNAKQAKISENSCI